MVEKSLAIACRPRGAQARLFSTSSLSARPSAVDNFGLLAGFTGFCLWIFASNRCRYVAQ